MWVAEHIVVIRRLRYLSARFTHALIVAAMQTPAAATLFAAGRVRRDGGHVGRFRQGAHLVNVAVFLIGTSICNNYVQNKAHQFKGGLCTNGVISPIYFFSHGKLCGLLLLL